MKKSLAYGVQMTLEIPDAEKRIAEKAEESFESLLSHLKISLEHLDLIYKPFSKRDQVDSEEIHKHRAILRKYRDKVKENFENVLKVAYNSVSLMSEFSTDSSVEELMNSFVANLRELEKQVNYLLSIFSNLDSADFKDILIASIELIKKQSAQLRQLVNDRVLEYIDTNILAKNWESLVNDKFQDKIKSKTPLIIQLYRERQEKLLNH